MFSAEIFSLSTLLKGLKTFFPGIECAGRPRFPRRCVSSSSTWTFPNSFHRSKMNPRRVWRQAAFFTTKLNLCFKLPFFQSMETQSQATQDTSKAFWNKTSEWGWVEQPDLVPPTLLAFLIPEVYRHPPSSASLVLVKTTNALCICKFKTHFSYPSYYDTSQLST